MEKEEKTPWEKTEETAVRSAKTPVRDRSTSGGKNAPGVDFDFDVDKFEIDLEQMFKSGVHFGHHKSRKNPRAEEYIFGVKNGINIIDLQKTAERLKTAMDFLEKTAAGGEDILFVGTKKQAKRLIRLAAEKCDMPFVSERWLGGTFTNFPVISRRTKYLREGQEKMEKGEYSKYTKFEQMKIKEELERLEKRMGGIKNMTKLPGAIFCAGIIEDKLAVKEAASAGIPIVALVDTNVSPEGIDYPIPANEDAVSSLRLMFLAAVKAVLDGRSKIKKTAEEKKES